MAQRAFGHRVFTCCTLGCSLLRTVEVEAGLPAEVFGEEAAHAETRHCAGVRAYVTAYSYKVVARH